MSLKYEPASVTSNTSPPPYLRLIDSSSLSLLSKDLLGPVTRVKKKKKQKKKLSGATDPRVKTRSMVFRPLIHLDSR
jgi:hypothetical protein